jgi:hypothetical protein
MNPLINIQENGKKITSNSSLLKLILATSYSLGDFAQVPSVLKSLVPCSVGYGEGVLFAIITRNLISKKGTEQLLNIDLIESLKILP